MSQRKLLTVLAIVGGLLGIGFLLLPLTGTVKIYQVPTGGMSPTIQPGDRVTASRIFRPAHTVSRGDLVVFRADQARASLRGRYIQRVVATGGDRIELVDGVLHVNGTRLPDRDGKVPRPARPAPGWSALSYPLVIPAGQVFTLGDNHDNSLDSRYFGPFPVEAITHSADRIIFPLSRAGKIE